LLLGDIVPTLTSQMAKSAGVDRWFFIRYGDPDWHVRLRFHSQADHAARVLNTAAAAVAPAVADGRVWKVQLDTYEREIERYGGDAGMIPSEEIFWRDSQTVIAILQQLSGDEGVQARWQICLRSWDLLLSDLGFPLQAKLHLVQEWRSGSARQARSGKALERAMGDRFRRERKALEALFDPAQQSGHPLAGSLELLQQRSQALQPSVHALRAADVAGRIGVSIVDLARSYLHMHANRLLRSSHGSHELVLFDFLARMYESQAARAKGRGASEPTTTG
jgi:thiopeptide-type bacteriocin biosynthesis protein